MHRPPARRPRHVAVVLTLLAACSGGDGGRTEAVYVVARPCRRPTNSFGLGVPVADDVVATAAHTVEGALRKLTVDHAEARVAAIDPRTDLALLAVETGARPIELSDAVPEEATVLGPDGPIDVRIVRTGLLVVNDATDQRRYEREVHTFAPRVSDGTSGAPLVDDDGRLLGIVVLANTRADVAYAVTARELGDLLDQTADSPPTRVEAAGTPLGRNTCDDR